MPSTTSAEAAGRPSRVRVKSERGAVVDPPRHAQSVATLAELVAVAPERRRQGPLVADLFCGCGGLSLGAEAAGFVPVLGIDHDAFALKTWGSLFPGLAADLDLGDPSVVDEVGAVLREIDIDMIVGGPPCQPFSRAGRSLLKHLVETGRRDAHDERRELWRSFLDVVELSLPKIVLMENVPELVLGDETILVRSIVDHLERLGYGVATRIVSTLEHGVPQHRQRAIIVGLRGGKQYNWPERARVNPTLHSAIGDLPRIEAGWNRVGPTGADPYTPMDPADELTAWFRSGLEAGESSLIRDHVTRSVRPDDLEIFRSMDSRTKYSEIDPSLKRYRDDIFDDKYKRLDWDQPSRSITAHLAKDGYWYIHPEQHRTLTIREAARIQTFPDRVRFAGPPSASLRQIGNAVPPLAAFHLIEAARQSLDSPSSALSTRVISSRLRRAYRPDQLATPWLNDLGTAWQVIQCELLGLRAGQRTVRWIHGALRRLTHPSATIADTNELHALFAGTAHEKRLETLLSAAEWYEMQDEDPFVSSRKMARNPLVPLTLARLAALVSCPDEAPVLSTSAVLRLVARYTGTRIDSFNRNSEGRLAIARMIGGSVLDDDTESERHAQLGLLEIAARHCLPGEPSCDGCELRPGCAFAQTSVAVAVRGTSVAGRSSGSDLRIA